MTQIEKIRKSKPVHAVVPWLFLVNAAIFIVLIMHRATTSAGESVFDGLYACAFATFLIGYVAASQQRLDVELAAEIDALKRRLDPADQADRDSG